MIIINDEFRGLFRDFSLEDFFSMEGEVFKEIQNRRTVKFERGGQAFFVKAHRGVGWLEILKNLVLLRAPVLGAANEWHAIHKIHSIGLQTMQAAGYGEEGMNPANRNSFLLTRALEDTVDLETLAGELAQKPGTRESVNCRRTLLRRVAWITKTMHEGGINHRDFYLCHLRLDTRQGDPCALADSVQIHIMDLHRAQIREKTPLRWLAKDISGLLYSAVHGPAGINISTGDMARFMKVYTGCDLRVAVTRHRPLWRAVVRRYCKDYQKQYRRKPQLTPFLRQAL